MVKTLLQPAVPLSGCTALRTATGHLQSSTFTSLHRHRTHAVSSSTSLTLPPSRPWWPASSLFPACSLPDSDLLRRARSTPPPSARFPPPLRLPVFAPLRLHAPDLVDPIPSMADRAPAMADPADLAVDGPGQRWRPGTARPPHRATLPTSAPNTGSGWRRGAQLRLRGSAAAARALRPAGATACRWNKAKKANRWD